MLCQLVGTLIVQQRKGIHVERTLLTWAPPAHKLLWGHFYTDRVCTCFRLPAIISSPADKLWHEGNEWLWHICLSLWGSIHFSSSCSRLLLVYINVARIREFTLVNAQHWWQVGAAVISEHDNSLQQYKIKIKKNQQEKNQTSKPKETKMPHSLITQHHSRSPDNTREYLLSSTPPCFQPSGKKPMCHLAESYH